MSPPPQADNDSLTATGSDMVYTKPFAPWKPGDAYSVESDLSDWRLLLGSVQDGSQAPSAGFRPTARRATTRGHGTCRTCRTS